MATFKFGRDIDIHWNGYDIQGPAETIFSIPDQLYEEFNGDIAPVEPTLVWIDTNEFQTLENIVSATTLSASLPIALTTTTSGKTISLSSTTALNGYLLTADGSGGTIWTAASTSGSGNAEVLRHSVKNTTGTTIPKGSAVYVSGATGDNALISLASASSEVTSSKTIGITAESIANDAFGYVIEAGYLTGIDTSATTAGAAVWLGNTPGSLVFVSPPAEPSHSVYLGVVVRVQSNNGSILVKVQNGYELNELHDVFVNSVSTALPLVYSSTSSGWIAQALSSVGIADNAVTSAKINAAAVNTAKITSGAALNGYVLTADGAGAAAFLAASGGISSVIGTSPISASGTTAITVSIQSASTSVAGAVKLTDSISSTSVSTAATPNSVKSAYDLANTAVQADPFSAFMFGSSSVIGNAPRWLLLTNLSGTSGRILHNRFIPHKNFTVSSLSFTGSNTASVSLTLCRFGIYTRSGTTFTLVARTASDTTLFNTTNTKYTRALDTTDGYPATYDLTAGTEYWVSVIQVGTTMGNFITPSLRLSASANNATGGQQYIQNSQADLVASSTGTLQGQDSGVYAEVS